MDESSLSIGRVITFHDTETMVWMFLVDVKAICDWLVEPKFQNVKDSEQYNSVAGPSTH